jgi:phosphatidylethanolamine/phosphatidyl-N-methylethanolamine N-methyltransferase
MAAEVLTFFRAWLSRPLQVGAIAPSSAMLAELMTKEISATHAPVLELGAGTGVFTQALVARGLSEADLTLIEYSADFSRLLRQRFPAARVRCMDAARLSRAGLFEGASAGAIVSGLPLLSMTPKRVMAILSGAFGFLRQDGAFYQFTYGPKCPVPQRILDRLGLKSRRIGHTRLNVPPAAVYRISRRPPTAVGARWRLANGPRSVIGG